MFGILFYNYKIVAATLLVLPLILIKVFLNRDLYVRGAAGFSGLLVFLLIGERTQAREET